MSFLPVSSLLRVFAARVQQQYLLPRQFHLSPFTLSSVFIICLATFITLSPLLPVATPMHAISERACLERIWPDFQRCREKQREHFRYGHFSFGLSSFSTDVYQPKYRTECCSYWELIECVHKASEAYCTNEVDLKKLHSFLEMVGVSVPLYVCADEYPKGSWRCRIPIWLWLVIFLAIFCLLVLMVLVYVCIRKSK